MAPQTLHKRQLGSGNGNNGYNGYDGYDGGHLSWWWTPAGLAVRYSIVAFLFVAVLLFFVGGYYHAQRRVKKGLPPLRYHRWMLRSPAYNQQRPAYGGRPTYAYYPDPNNAGYQMEGYPPPPPAYHNAEAPPPVYAPPPGASKAMADQNFHGTHRAGESSSSGGAGPA